MKPPATARGQTRTTGPRPPEVPPQAPPEVSSQVSPETQPAGKGDAAEPAEKTEVAHDAPPMFGAALEPVLHRACGGKLSAVSWFRTDWQRGGALTGYATFTDGDGRKNPVVVKLPVPPIEREWLVRLSHEALQKTKSAGAILPGAGGVTPKVFAHGEALNGYDLAWVVMEHVQHGPLGNAWHGREFDLLVEAAGVFYAVADRTPLPIDAQPAHRDWDDILRRARKTVKSRDWPHGQAWKNALKHAGKHLDNWRQRWDQRDFTGWLHGDLHLGNAMSRTPPPHPPTPEVGSSDLETAGETPAHSAVLLDLACVRPGHWVQDAVYCEHLYWSRRKCLGGRKLVSLIAKARRSHGLDVGGNWSELADLKRKLLAMATPVTFADHHGTTAHLDAALALLSAA